VATLRPDVVVVNADPLVHQVLRTVAAPQADARVSSVLILADPRKPVILPPWKSGRVPSFLVKDVSPKMLAETIRRVADGEWVIDPRIAVAALMGNECLLTTRELEILALAAEGASVSEIADQLYLALGTVRNYLSKIIGKIGARNRIDAIRIAREAGWLL
jgi:two-component system, NarL family, response regulator DesR